MSRSPRGKYSRLLSLVGQAEGSTSSPRKSGILYLHYSILCMLLLFELGYICIYVIIRLALSLFPFECLETATLRNIVIIIEDT